MFTAKSSLKTLFFSSTVCLAQLAFAQQAPQQRNFPQPPPAKEVTITAIPGVIDASAKWKIAYQSPENSDGIVGTADGGLLFAQEQTNRINKLDKDDNFSDFLKTGHGPGAIGIGPKGQIYAVERTCTDPGRAPEACKENTGIAILTPTRKVLADNYMGKNLGRVNDLVVDKKGGAYFTSGGLYYVSPKGQVISIGENLRTNGVQLSRDEKTLYVTNGPAIAAFDVQPDGSAKNQREFGKLEGGGNGDGLAVDSEGRLYCATSAGVQVLSPEGKYLGLIPIPRNGISVAFSGPGKKTLYVVGNGAVDHYGREITTPPGVRNTAMTIYKIPMLATGFKGRAK
jgi:gluconolactonase